jgi:hypothetical protein
VWRKVVVVEEEELEMVTLEELDLQVVIIL